MVKYNVEILGDTLINKQTHYDAPVTFQSRIVIITVRVDVVAEFQRKYRMPITSAGRIIASVELTLNEDKESKYKSLSKPHFICAVNSIDDIVLPNLVNRVWDRYHL
ncbi:MAG: hypothetical protein AABX96_01480 [Nanoarchaeota archaeon]